MSDRKPQLTLRYDFTDDVLTIGGIRYAGEMMRMFGKMPVGSVLELVARDDGVITLKVLNGPDVKPDVPSTITVVVDGVGQQT